MMRWIAATVNMMVTGDLDAQIAALLEDIKCQMHHDRKQTAALVLQKLQEAFPEWKNNFELFSGELVGRVVTPEGK